MCGADEGAGWACGAIGSTGEEGEAEEGSGSAKWKGECWESGGGGGSQRSKRGASVGKEVDEDKEEGEEPEGFEASRAGAGARECPNSGGERRNAGVVADDASNE